MSDNPDTEQALKGPFNKDIKQYSLFKAIEQTTNWLMEYNPGLPEAHAFELIRFKTNPSLAFPGSDIQDIKFYYYKNYLMAEMTLNMMGLYGSSSPLPSWYAEAALGDSTGATQLRGFLDLFNHRIQRLIQGAWKKYRYPASFRAGATDIFSSRMFALVGLGHQPLRTNRRLNWNRLLPYIGLLNQRSHSASLITSVLRYYFQHSAITIKQCVVSYLKIPQPQQSRLGQTSHQVSSTAILGKRVRDRSASFRICITDLDWEPFHEFLPGSKNYNALNELVRFSLKDPLNYEIELTLKKDVVKPLKLENDTICQLGWTTWMGERKKDHAVLIPDTLTENYK